MADVFPPALPPGRVVDLGRRGSAFVREVAAAPGAPCVVLLHGWLATADLNWYRSFRWLNGYRVLAPDQRGHGRGTRSWRPFRLHDCADDVAALCSAVGVEGPVIVAGYSMGGPIAQLTWRRHHDLVAGLVLCATSRHFPGSPLRRGLYLAVGTSVAVTPAPVRRRLLASALARDVRHPAARRWLTAEVERHDVRALLAAGSELGRFDSSAWIGGVDVPTAVVVTTRDLVVPTANQRALAAAIPGARTFDVAGDHMACADERSGFGPALRAAVDDVAVRAGLRTADADRTA